MPAFLETISPEWVPPTPIDRYPFRSHRDTHWDGYPDAIEMGRTHFFLIGVCSVIAAFLFFRRNTLADVSFFISGQTEIDTRFFSYLALRNRPFSL